MIARKQSLEQYASRRFSLAGAGILSGSNPYFLPVDALRQQYEASGQTFTSFAQYDYLGMGDEPAVRAAARDAVDTFGTGAGASRLVGGERSIHRALEMELARFIGAEDALSLVSGYGTNLALIGHLLTSDDLILVDELGHNSILLGTHLSRAETRTFSHNDVDEIESVLQSERQNYRRVLIVVEGLYSMEGDLPDLPRLLDLCERHGAWIMIDEAHSIGVLGATGRGLCEHFGVDPGRVDLIVGTLSKALATCGGFICGKSAVIEWLRYTLPGFVYSVGLSPHIAAAVRAALRILVEDPERVARLHQISQYFVEQARRHDFDVGTAIGAGVVPIMFTDAMTTMQASKALLDVGIYTPPVVQIGVPKDSPRLRFFLSCSHSTSDVDRVFETLNRWRHERADARGMLATREELRYAD